MDKVNRKITIQEKILSAFLIRLPLLLFPLFEVVPDLQPDDITKCEYHDAPDDEYQDDGPQSQPGSYVKKVSHC
jgi:hypothetical protein